LIPATRQSKTSGISGTNTRWLKQYSSRTASYESKKNIQNEEAQNAKYVGDAKWDLVISAPKYK
jgi:hypothetical protein